EWMWTTTFSRVRSIRILEMPDRGYFFLTYLRIFWSSTKSSAKSCLLAYHELSQSVMMPVRNPVGRTFCPTALLLVPDGHDQVGVPLLDRVGGAAGPRLDPLQDRPAVDPALDHDQVVDVPRPAVLGVAQGALEDGLDQPGRSVRVEPQRLQGF